MSALPSVVELCSGLGGATEGMIRAGLSIEMTYDIWPVAVAAHKRWHPSIPCEVRDVSTISPDELAGRLVWASLPCQPWSTANRHADRRGKLHPHYYSLAHLAHQVRHARATILENVPGLLWTREGKAEMLELERACHQLGLIPSVHLLYSHEFGVPQFRRRAFVVIAPELTLMPMGDGSSMEVAPAVLSAPMGGKNTRYATGAHAREAAVTAHPSGINRRELEPSVCATEGRASSQSDPRTFQRARMGRSIGRCAELQGVPVPEDVNRGDAYTLIGNAVPPVLAEAVSRAVFVRMLEPAGVLA